MPDSLAPLTAPLSDDGCDCAEPSCTEITRRLTQAGLRPTRQRVDLATLLFRQGHRHVTAEQLQAEALGASIKVSLATIYNTLNQFRDAGLLREVVVEAGSTWFDTNTDTHHHFFHERSRQLQDIAAEQLCLPPLPCLPSGTCLSRVDIIIRVQDRTPGRASDRAPDLD